MVADGFCHECIIQETMIFVAVGTQKFPCNRLMKELDSSIENGKICDEIFAQLGTATYIPKHYNYQRFLPQEVFNQKIEQCDLLVTHGGVATIMYGIRLHKPVIVVPRLARYGEHIDDHQTEIAESFATLNFVLMCSENDDLAERISHAKSHCFDAYFSQRSRVKDVIRNYLRSI